MSIAIGKMRADCKRLTAARAVLLVSASCIALSGCVPSVESGLPEKSAVVAVNKPSVSLAGTNDDAETVTGVGEQQLAHISNDTKFSSAQYGVQSSPRVSTVKRPRKGGGRYQIGKPYKVKGRWYKPEHNPNLRETGLASWYGPNFHGRLTANGEIYDQYSLTAAHPTMPLPSYAYVTNLENGRKIKVRVNDRGPFAPNRVIDLSSRAAHLLGYTMKGLANVKVEYAGEARMDGQDEEMLIASYVGPASADEGAPPVNQSGSGTMLAMADTSSSSGSGAIDQNFQPSGQPISTVVAIPTARPTLFEGIPLEEGGQIVYRPVETTSGPVPVNALSFAAEVSPLEIQMAELKAIEIGYYGDKPDMAQTLSIGLLSDPAIALAKMLVNDLEGARFETLAGTTRLHITERNANTALVRLRQAGLALAVIE